MIGYYLVFVHNEQNEEFTFKFNNLHDALTLYSVAKHDDDITIVTVDAIECDDNDNDIFVGSDNIRWYEKGNDYVRN